MQIEKKPNVYTFSKSDENWTQYGLVIRSAKSSAGDLHSGHLINKGAPGSDSIEMTCFADSRWWISQEETSSHWKVPQCTPAAAVSVPLSPHYN